jgi:WhiB family redox-sensing transcriptional regulator
VEPVSPRLDHGDPVSRGTAVRSFLPQSFPTDDVQLDPREPDVAESWQERALCAQTDPEAFFPEKGGSTKDAKRMCFSCDVRQDCLDFALDTDERFGVWGGLSERERRRLKRAAG